MPSPALAERRNLRRRPDEDDDIVVYVCRGTWTIWLGGDKQGERATRASAVEVACAVAAARSRPAWLLDEAGYPLKPVEHR